MTAIRDRFAVVALGGGALAVALALALPALAQTVQMAQAPEVASPPTEPAVPPPPPAPPAYPGSYRVVPELLALVDEAADARQVLASLATPKPSARALASAGERAQRLAAALAGIQAQSYPRLDSLSALRERALHQKASVERLIADASEQLQGLDDLRTTWLARREFWAGWRRHLRDDPQLGQVGDDLKRAGREIDAVLAAAETAGDPLLGRQRALEHTRRQLLALLGGAEELLAERRRRLLEIDAPPLLSAEHRAQLGRSAAEIGRGIAAVRRVDGAFLREHAWLLALQFAALLAVALLARRFRDLGRGDDRWAILLSHPWAMGTFVAVVTLAYFYAPAPPLWDVGQWALLGMSTSLLASGMFQLRAKRWLVYALSAFFVATVAATAAGFPDPLLRLGQAAGCLLGALWLLLLGRANRRSDDHRPGFVFGVRAGAAVLAVVLVAQLVGFNTLAQWLLESALATAFLGFAALFLIRLGRGALRALVEAGERVPAFAGAGDEITERLVWIFELAVGVWAALFALTIWEVYDGPWQAWTDLMGKGVSIGAHRITAGQVLLAVVAVYAALLISRIMRSLLDEEWVERRQLDRGVADSVRTLVHYLLVVAGLLFALSFAGFDLRNFAIVAGALGVGIGFGLQNVVNNFVSGLILLFERPVRVGDVVVLGEQWGTIERIGLRSTVVTTFDRSEMIVPNSDLISEKVINWTLSNRVARILIPVGVAYGSDVETVVRTLLEVAGAHPEVRSDPAPSCVFTRFGDSSLDFELRVWVDDVELRLQVTSELLIAIDRRFREAGLEIPFPQRDLHLRSVDGSVEWRKAKDE